MFVREVIFPLLCILTGMIYGQGKKITERKCRRERSEDLKEAKGNRMQPMREEISLR